MKREVIATAKTVEDAIAKGVRELGAPEEDVNVEVLTQPKKGFLGIGEVPAQVKVTYEQDGADAALCFVRTIAKEMGLEATVTIEKDPGEGEARISLIGDEAGTLIGYHGETLDALQYLATLTANKVQEESGERKYQKIVVDVENYRAKREETLRTLARRMAGKVRKYGKNITLEPMSPYERRIIHSEVQQISGVTTESIGEGDARRVVIHPEGKGVTEKDLAAAGVKGTPPTGKKRRRRRHKRSGDSEASEAFNEAELETPEMPTDPEDFFEIVDASVYLNEDTPSEEE